MPNFGKNRLADIIVAIAVVVIAAFLALPSHKNVDNNFSGNDSITGYAKVSDGDTIQINGRRIRLIDIDAPELYQFCTLNGASYPCGEQSKQHLINLIDKRKITCISEKRDKFDRFLGRCSVDSMDINRQMVEDGWAVSYYGYQQQENKARKQLLGIWAGSFERPRDWRRNHPRKN